MSRITTSGPMKLFHEPMKVISPSVPNAGSVSGSTMRQKMPNSPQPSSRAASTSSRGTVLPMYCRIMKMPSAPQAPGTIRALCSFSQPSQAMVSTVGTMPRKPGSSIVASTRPKSRSRPGKSSSAKAWPASEHSSRFSTVTAPAT